MYCTPCMSWTSHNPSTHTPANPAEEPECREGTVTTYMGDASLLHTGSDIQTVQEQAQTALDRVTDYLSANCLCLNRDKTKTILIAKPSQKAQYTYTLIAETKTIHPITQLKVPGV